MIRARPEPRKDVKGKKRDGRFVLSPSMSRKSYPQSRSNVESKADLLHELATLLLPSVARSQVRGSAMGFWASGVVGAGGGGFSIQAPFGPPEHYQAFPGIAVLRELRQGAPDAFPRHQARSSTRTPAATSRPPDPRVPRFRCILPLSPLAQAQVAGMNDSMQPPAMQCERWLQESFLASLFMAIARLLSWTRRAACNTWQSTVSLCLRSLHQLAAVPSEVRVGSAQISKMPGHWVDLARWQQNSSFRSVAS